MKIYEYGEENPECILLIHPSLVTWDYFENVIPLLEEHYHLLIPAIPGYDLKDDSQFSTVEKVASQLADELLQKGIREVKAIYGCSILVCGKRTQGQRLGSEIYEEVCSGYRFHLL